MSRHTIPALCLTLLTLVGSPPTLSGEEDEQITRIYRPKHAQADLLENLVRQSGTLVRAVSGSRNRRPSYEPKKNDRFETRGPPRVKASSTSSA